MLKTSGLVSSLVDSVLTLLRKLLLLELLELGNPHSDQLVLGEGRHFGGSAKGSHLLDNSLGLDELLLALLSQGLAAGSLGRPGASVRLEPLLLSSSELISELLSLPDGSLLEGRLSGIRSIASIVASATVSIESRKESIFVKQDRMSSFQNAVS